MVVGTLVACDTDGNNETENPTEKQTQTEKQIQSEKENEQQTEKTTEKESEKENDSGADDNTRQEPDEVKASEGLEYGLSGQGYILVGMGKCTDTEVVIPKIHEGLPVIGIGTFGFKDYAKFESVAVMSFKGAAKLTSITIPNSVISIGENALFGCRSLTNIIVDENNPNYKSIGGNLYSKDGKTLIHYACGKADTTFITPDGVTSIGSNAFGKFGDYDNLTSVTIGNSVSSIGGSVFGYCSNLTSINVDENNLCYKSIDGNLYSKDGNTLIQYARGKADISFEISDSVTSIGDSAFYNCHSLMSVTIGKGVTSIGNSAFNGCYSLIEVINKSSLNIVVKGNYLDYGGVAYNALEVHNGDSKIVKKDGYLFYTCEDVNYLVKYAGTDTQLTLPENYNGEKYEIYEGAFEDCDSLTTVTIPDNVTRIRNHAFGLCDSLTSVTVGNGVTHLGDCVFDHCSSLTNITIGNSVTSIGYSALYDCSSLTSINFNGTKEQWRAIFKPHDWNYNTGEYTIHCTDGDISK